MSKIRFLGSFLAWFAILLGLWSATNALKWWRSALLTLAAGVGPALHGWILEQPQGAPPTWVNGTVQAPLAVQFESLAIGVVPVLALLAATPATTARRRFGLCFIGTCLIFFVHLLVIVMFPVLTYNKHAVTDVAGTFLGLVAFAGAPAIIWFCLVFDKIQQWLPALRR